MSRTVRLAAAIVLGLATCLAPASASRADEQSEPSSSDVDRAVRFRTLFGLESDPQHIDAVLRDPTASEEFGTPLTESELGEIRRRIAFQDALGPLNAYLRANPDDYAGRYLDQGSGGILDIAIHADGNPDLDSLRALVPPGAEYRTRSVDYSSRELDETYERLSSLLPGLLADGLRVVRLGVDIQSNRVVLGVEDASEAEMLALEMSWALGSRCA